LPQTTVSQHLARLRGVGIVRRRRHGSSVFYALADARIAQACDLIRGVLVSHLTDERALADQITHDVRPMPCSGT
jgi:ArsR family transcriptional regulator